MIHELVSRHGISLHGVAVVLGLLIYAAVSHTYRQRRHPSASIAWLIALVVVPYVALPLYLMIGRRKFVRTSGSIPAPRAVLANPSLPPMSAHERLAAAMGLPPAAAFERLSIHQDGAQALQALSDMIDAARHTIDLCTFHLRRDAVGNALVEQLARRAREGVAVRLMIDGIGVYLGARPNLRRLASAGVRVALFVSPLGSALRGRTNLRNHRKLLIVDGHWMWCGGRNLAAEYFEGEVGTGYSRPAWIDLSFDLRGSLAQQGQQQFDHDWSFATQDPTPNHTSTPVAPLPPASQGQAGQIIASGPDQTDDTLYNLIVSGCFAAESRITAVTPYFVPDSTLLMALTLAARRGVDVNLVLPCHSNHRLADIARHVSLRELTAAGGKVWLCDDMIHAKAVLIDSGFALVGSANLDERSLFLNYELMVAFYDPSVVRQFSEWVDLQRSKASAYEPRQPGVVMELVEGLVRWAAFQL